MSSSRLPGKVLGEILDHPMILLQLERLRLSKELRDLVVLTSVDKSDDTLVELLIKHGIKVYRGSLNNVYERYRGYLLHENFETQTIVRVTADCPLLDWHLLDRIVNFFETNNFDYASNTLTRTFPRGLDIEVFRAKTLIEAKEHFTLTDFDKEHVTPIFYRNPQFYKLGNFVNETDHSNLRWTVDTYKDFNFAKTIYENLYRRNRAFSTEEILEFLSMNPQLNNFENNQ
jgi:spore coat polysaccharide biosynthesis protein SpsF (cytidylyltransferase family)